MKILRNKIDKREIALMPRVQFEGNIVVVEDEAKAEEAVDYLLAQPVIGFDTETRPTFRPGPMHPVALLQVASRDTCYLFRLCKMGIPDALVRLLSDKRVKKVCLSWSDDTQQLLRRRSFAPGEFFDLQTHVGEFGIEDRGLQKLYANLFGKRISKSQQLSNWEANMLTEPQMLYASTDAWACVMIYEELQRLKQTGDWQLKVMEETKETKNV